MNKARPDPMVPAEVDLREFAFMPLDVVRLRDSELVIMASGEGFRAAVLLWCASWHQVPAASLPTDERLLANLAGFGRDVKGWRKVAKEALHNYEECTDGRLYHPVIADKAVDAWNRKKVQRQRTEAARNARLRKDRNKARTEPATEPVTRSVTESTGQRPIDIHNENTPLNPPAGGTLVAAHNGQSPLATKVLTAFVAKSADKGLTWPPTEIEHVNRLVERAEMEPDPEAWCKRFLETAWRLKQSGTGIWKDRPWMPRTFCGVKAITWVIEAMGSQNDAGDEASRRYYAEKIANRQAGRK